MRKQKLVHPRLQGRLLTLVLAAAAASVAVHAAMSVWALSALAAELPSDGQHVRDALPGSVILSSLLTLLVVVPSFLLLGLAASARVFGPLHRFRAFLEQVARGERSEPCHIRGGDELQEMCALLNTVSEPLRSAAARERAPAERPGRAAA